MGPPFFWCTITGVFVMSYAVSYFLLPGLSYVDPAWIGVPFVFDRTRMLPAMGWSAVGLLAFLHGRYLNGWTAQRSYAFRGALAPEWRTCLRPERLWRIWGATTAILAMVVLWLCVAQGWERLFLARGEVFLGKGITFNLYLALMLYSSAFALLIFAMLRSRGILLLQSAILLVVGFGARGLLVTFLVAVALVAGRVQHQQALRVFRTLARYGAIAALIGVSCLSLVFLRSREQADWSNARRAVLNTFEEGQMFAAVYAHYSDHLLHGQTIWDIRFLFLPQQVYAYLPQDWVASKPSYYGKAVFEQDLGLISRYGESWGSTTFGMLSELFANFGVLGIIVGMEMWGWFYAFVERLGALTPDCLGFLVYLMLYIFQGWIFRHGLLGLVQSQLVPALFFPVILALAYARRRSSAC
ncbi:MAG TPA: hypothetical protein VGZ29_15340 [Terriglobia bacterium]|nr:hypothetical protein [Terriglobia bacterium]